MKIKVILKVLHVRVLNKNRWKRDADRISGCQETIEK